MIARQSRNAAEREFLTRKLAKLEGERRKLLDAYYAGAIDVTMLKAEQDRLGREVRAAEERLTAVDAGLQEWQEVLGTAMRFAANCADAYAKASDRTRRLFNKAVFKKVLVRDGRVAGAEFQEPFDALFSSPEFEYGNVVETTGLEPATPCLQSRTRHFAHQGICASSQVRGNFSPPCSAL